MPDDLGRELITREGDGLHPPALPHTLPGHPTSCDNALFSATAVRLSRWLDRPRHTDQAIAGHQLSERVLTPPLSPGRPHGHHHVAHVSRTVMHTDLHVV